VKHVAIRQMLPPHYAFTLHVVQSKNVMHRTNIRTFFPHSFVTLLLITSLQKQ